MANNPPAIVGDLEKEDSYCTNSIVNYLLFFKIQYSFRTLLIKTHVTNSKNMSLSKFPETMKDREAWGGTKSRT